MKKNTTVLISFFVIIVLSMCISSCNQAGSVTDVWSEAEYTEGVEFGNGKKTVLVEVVAEDKSVTFTIHSDKKTLGEAMLEHNLIEGEKGAYGLYVKKVNGILVDYDKNKCYWGLYKNGESLMTGVDGVDINDGEYYEIVYTK